jgi:hypothetical protein
VEPELTIIALSLWMIVFLGLTCVVFALVSMWKENRFDRPLKGIIWFTFAIIVSCAIALLAAYVQKARIVGKVSHRITSLKVDERDVFVLFHTLMVTGLD